MQKNTLISILSCVAILFGAGLVFVGQQNYSTYAPKTKLAQDKLSVLKKQVNKRQSKIVSLQNKQQSQQKQKKTVQSVITNYEYDSQANLAPVYSDLTTLFNKIYTYDTGAVYEANRKSVLSEVKDQTFADYYKSSLSDDGVSAVDAQEIKSKTTDVDVYATGNNQYFAIVSYTPYKKSVDLNYDLQSKSSFFDIDGTTGNWTKFAMTKIN